MFRRVENTLEPDPSFPADLKELGFFINSSGDIRMINAPEKPYVYHATNNDRVNEVRREAMQTCQRKEAEKRLSYLGLNRIHLPDFTVTKPNGPHVPILAPPPEVLKTRKRIVVMINDTIQDLGVLAYRQLQRELGINGGSVVNFAKEMIKRSSPDNDAEKDASIFRDGYVLEDKTTTPGLIVLNTGQLLYSHKYNQAMTLRSWLAMPRKSITHDMVRIYDEENRVPGHRDAKEHVKTVFDQVICNPDRVSADAEVYVIAIEDGTESVLGLLTDDFNKYGTRITAMALVHSIVDDSQIKDQHVRAFLHQRARQWRFSDLTSNPQHCTALPKSYDQHASQCSSSKDTPSIMQSTKHISWHETIPTGAVSPPTKAFHHLAIDTTPLPPSTTDEEDTEITEWSSGQAPICPTFAGSTNAVSECIFTCPTVQHAILSFFQDVAQDPHAYRNPRNLKPYSGAPQPSPDSPLALSPDNTNKNDGQEENGEDLGLNFNDPVPQIPHEQAELQESRDRLAELCIAFSACPSTIPELVRGRAKLEKKIRVMETRVGELEKKIENALLLDGGHGGGVEEDKGTEEGEKKKKKGGEWKMQVEGPKVRFAGTMVDSELLKAAGLGESAEEGLGVSVGADADAVPDQHGGDGDGDGEKGFV